jgi:transposase
VTRALETMCRLDASYESVGTGDAPDAPHHQRGYGQVVFLSSLGIRPTAHAPPSCHVPSKQRTAMKKTRQGQPVLARGRAVVGMDVGKRKHAATALSPQGEVLAQLASFPNTRQGVDRLEKELLLPAGGPGKVLVAMEATGHYWMCLHAELTRRGYECAVLNPVLTGARAKTRIRKTSNDRIDSGGIARLVLSGEARASRVPDPETAELRLLVRHRRRLVQAASNMERYAHTLVDRIFPEYAGIFSKPFLPSAQKLIREVGLAPHKLVAREPEVRALLENASRGKFAPETIDQLLQAAKDSIGVRRAEEVSEQQLCSVFDYLDSLRQPIATIEKQLEQRVEKLGSVLPSLGISPVLAAVIHAESDPITDFASADEYVAYTGLDPSRRESGDSIHHNGRISKRGSPVLRHALFLAAFVIYRKHQYFHRIYRKHRRSGKEHDNALVIVARHLARVIWRMLTDERPFSKRAPKKPSPSGNGQRNAK